MSYEYPNYLNSKEVAFQRLLALIGYSEKEYDNIIKTHFATPNATAYPLNGYSKNTEFYEIPDIKQRKVVFGIEEKVETKTSGGFLSKKKIVTSSLYSLFIESRGNSIISSNSQHQLIVDCKPQKHQFYSLLKI